jgi:hypothetical protein
MEIAVKNGKKALRLDTLKSNLPAQKMYENLPAEAENWKGRQDCCYNLKNPPA